MEKKGAVLAENIIFIVLNLIFISLLFLFLFNVSNQVSQLEEIYAKQTAMIIDSAKPGMVVFLDMSKGFEKVKKDWGEEHLGEIVQIRDNQVFIQLGPSREYNYSFFNDIKVNKPYFLDEKGRQGYVFTFG